MELDPNIVKTAAGPLGSLSAMFLMRGLPWTTRVAIFVPGATAAFFASQALAAWLGIPEVLSGYALGFFAPAIGSKLLETIEAFDFSKLLRRVAAKLTGTKEDD